MGPGSTDRRLSDRGVTSIQFLLASALGLILFLMMANLVVVQYGRGAVRSALEQGVRAGSLSGSAAACEDTAADVLRQLLGGAMGDGIAVECAAGASSITASGSGTFASWTPMTPDFTIELTARATREQPP